MEFDEVYRGYVIRETKGAHSNYFVGESEVYRTAIRSDALRFTKVEALEYVNRQLAGHFVIEDAR